MDRSGKGKDHSGGRSKGKANSSGDDKSHDPHSGREHTPQHSRTTHHQEMKKERHHHGSRSRDHHHRKHKRQHGSGSPHRPMENSAAEGQGSRGISKFSDFYKILKDFKSKDNDNNNDTHESGHFSWKLRFVHIHTCVHLPTHKKRSVQIINTHKQLREAESVQKSRWHKSEVDASPLDTSIGCTVPVYPSSLDLWQALTSSRLSTSRSLKLYEWFQGRSSSKTGKGHVYLVHERVLSSPSTTNLHDHYLLAPVSKGFDVTDTHQHLVRQLLLALEDLHTQHGVVHGMLRPEHVVIIPQDGHTNSLDDNAIFVGKVNTAIKIKGLGACAKIGRTLPFFLDENELPLASLYSHYTPPELFTKTTEPPTDPSWRNPFRTTKTRAPTTTTVCNKLPAIAATRAHQTMDIWALGVTVFNMLSGMSQMPPHPFLHKDSDADDNATVNNREYQKRLQVHPFWNDGTVSLQARDFVTRCLQLEPRKRFSSAREALEHPWIAQQTVSANSVDYQEESDTDNPTSMTIRQKNITNPIFTSGKTLHNLQSYQQHQPLSKLQQAAWTVLASQNVLQQQKERLTEAFDTLDRNHDGKISRDELHAGFGAVFGDALDTPAELDDLFDRMDTDHSGFISYDEFLLVASFSATVELGQEEKLRKAFDRFDIQGTGKVPVASLQQVFSSLPDRDDASDNAKLTANSLSIQQQLQQADVDGDGYLSYDEFVAMMVEASDSGNNGTQKSELVGEAACHESEGKQADNKIVPAKAKPNVRRQISHQLQPIKGRTHLRFSAINFRGHQSHTQFYKEYRVIRELRDLEGGFLSEARTTLDSGATSLDLPPNTTNNSVEWFVCRHRTTAAERVVKIVPRSSRWISHDEEIRRTYNEYHTAKQMDHPSILKIYELFQGEQNIYAVMDLCTDSICSDVEKWGPLSEGIVAQVMHQVLSGLEYMHSLNPIGAKDGGSRCFVHGKISPATVLTCDASTISDQPNRIKIGGFHGTALHGISTNLTNKNESNESDEVRTMLLSEPSTQSPYIGTVFIAPEMKKKPSELRSSSDIYSCGVLAAWMLCQPRFTSYEGVDMSTLISFLGGVSENGKDFITQLLAEDETKRPTATKALLHPWLSHALDVAKPTREEKSLYNQLASVRFNGAWHLQQVSTLLLTSQLAINKGMRAIARVFHRTGLQIDERVSRQQVRVGMRMLVGRNVSRNELDEFWKQVDIDGTGHVDGAEFVVACLNELGVLVSSDMQKPFSTLAALNNDLVALKKDETTEHDLTTKPSVSKAVLVEVLKNSSTTEKEALHYMLEGISSHGDGSIFVDDLQGIMLKVAAQISTKWALPDTFSKVRGAALVRCGRFDKVAFQRDGRKNASRTFTDHYELASYIAYNLNYCTDKRSGEKCILKTVPKSYNEERKQDFLKEIEIMNTLVEAPNIALVVDVYEVDTQYLVVLEDNGSGGTLADELETFGPLTEADGRIFLTQLLRCVASCHTLNIVIRNLNLEAIMLTRNQDLDHFKICNLSAAAFYDDTVGLHGKVGAPGFMAPEMSKGRYGLGCDIWSVGVIAYLCLARSVSFELFVTDIKGLVKNGTFVFHDSSWNCISAGAKDFISHLLTWDPKTRPTASVALSREWLFQSSPSVPQTARMESVQEKACMTIFHGFVAIREESQTVHRVLKALGLASKESLSKVNVKSAYRAYFSRELPEKALDDMFLRLDADDMGIHYKEFVLACANEKRLTAGDNLDIAFSVFRTGPLGMISIRDVKEGLSLIEGRSMSDGTIDKRAIRDLLGHIEKLKEPFMPKDDITGLFLYFASDPNRRLQLGDAAMARRSFFTQEVSRLEDEYVIGDLVDEGIFGKVFACTHRISGATRALKIRKKTIDDRRAAVIFAEIDILKKLDHPNILTLFSLFVESGHYCLVTEYMGGGDLCLALDNYGSMAEYNAAILMNQLLLAVNYLHQEDTIHRDLKPENILFPAGSSDSNCISILQLKQFKLIDFARATECEELEVLTSRVTTPEYCSPEVVMQQYGQKADIYACGVTLYLCLTNAFPFDGSTTDEIYDAIMDGDCVVPDSVSDAGLDFLFQLLAYDEDFRPTASKALEHPWFAEQNVSGVKTIGDGKHSLPKRASTAAAVQKALRNLSVARSNKKQTIYALIAAQDMLKSEREAIDKAFFDLDLNHDGKLSKDEVRAGYAACFGEDLKPEEIDELFESLDTDNSGYLLYSEFVVAALNQKEVLTTSRTGTLRRAFDRFDTNHTGTISREDLKLLLREAMDARPVAGDSETMLEQLLDQVGDQDDGRISFDEFTSVMLLSTEEK